jgi:hypothetical protein
MARIRSIKPELWKSEKVPVRLPGVEGRQARLLWIAMWNFAEDHGVIRGNPRYIQAEILAYDEDVSMADVRRWLDLLEAGGFIVRYEREGLPYIWIRGFADHQRIEKPSKPSLPGPTDEERARAESSPTTPGALPESSVSPPGGSGVEWKGEELSAETADPPPLPPSEQLALVGETEPPSSESTTRKLSDQESFAEWFAQERKDALGEAWHPDNPIGVKRLNTELKWVKDLDAGLITAAARLYLLDPRRRNQSPPCSLLFFSRDRETYLHAAKTRGAA